MVAGQSDAGGYDVALNSRSRVEAAPDIQFGYREQRSSEKQTVADILKLGPRQKVSMERLAVPGVFCKGDLHVYPQLKCAA